MEYILLIHKGTEEPASEEQWNEFFEAARQSGLFAGGSEISRGELFGAKDTELLSDRIAGHMRFKTDSTDTGGDSTGRSMLLELLKTHPTVLQGGTIELCRMPKS